MNANYGGMIFDDTVRRQQLQDSRFNGIDYLEVDVTPGETNQRVLRLYFIPPSAATPQKVGTMLDDLDGNIDAFVILGGERVRNIQVLSVQRVGDHLELLVDRAGDFGDYRLIVNYEGATPPDDYPLDVFYREVTFNFKVGCPARFDCYQPMIAPPESEADLFIDYMAKDYDSFRQAMIDMLPRLIPDWTERRIADQGMMLLELLAYVGDQLSYYQDAVANEAYLETARQRISLRRHARLIDYRIHDGLSARTLVLLNMKCPKCEEGEESKVCEECGLIISAPEGEVRILRLMTEPQGVTLPKLIPAEREAEALSAAGIVFEIKVQGSEKLRFHKKLNKICLYAWQNERAYLPIGATSADLINDYASSSDWQLREGDLLLFEELIDPYTGEAIADPTRRHLVRLTHVETAFKDVLGSPIILTRVFWAEADALPFPIWINNVTHEGTALSNICVARGNLAIADQGRSYEEIYPEGETDLLDTADAANWQGFKLSRRALRFTLRQGPLAQSIPLDDLQKKPAAALYAFDPREAKAVIHSIESYTASNSTVSRTWSVVGDSLLSSDRFAEDAVVETDNLGRAQLRFGTNEYGAVPDNDSAFKVFYRVGIGPQGNIGADTLKYIVLQDSISNMANISEIRNLLPAWGGTAPESMEQIKRLAPAAIRADLKRAVTEADYARVTESHPAVERAIAYFHWTGSWYTVFIRVDPKGTNQISPELRTNLLRHVSAHAMTGYDIEIVDPIYIPLELTLDICVESGYFLRDVEQAVLETLSNQPLADGRRGFFHPDHFTFGQPLYISRIYAAVEAVSGVQSVSIRGLHRQDARQPDLETAANLARGIIRTGKFAVIRLDNDPNFPENGILHLNMFGGKA